MPPPSVIFITDKVKIRPELAFLGPVRTYRIFILRSFIYAFFVHPFVKGAAVVENSVNYDLNISLMCFFYKSYKKLITCLKIFLAGNSLYILCGIFIVSIVLTKHSVCIFHYHTDMRIYIVIILSIIFVV